MEKMFKDTDYSQLLTLGVDRVSVRLHRLLREDTGPRIVVLLGHSAAGKSAVLSRLAIDRTASDMDLYCSNTGVRQSLDTMKLMAEGISCPIIVCSNDDNLLDELRKH